MLHRDEFRRTHYARFYSGGLHFLGSMAVGLSIVAAMASQVHGPTALELVTVPVTFLYANVVEYWGHRGPMHRRYRRFRLLSGMFQRHAAQHHLFFTHQSMTADSTDDWQIILAHPVFLVFFLGIVGLPSGLILAAVATCNVTALFGITALLYGLIYEALHLAYHSPPASWVGRLPGVAALRHHHQVHHDPRLMTRYNFNITFPILDWLVGTWYSGADPSASADR